MPPEVKIVRQRSRCSPALLNADNWWSIEAGEMVARRGVDPPPTVNVN